MWAVARGRDRRPEMGGKSCIEKSPDVRFSRVKPYAIRPARIVVNTERSQDIWADDPPLFRKEIQVPV